MHLLPPPTLAKWFMLLFIQPIHSEHAQFQNFICGSTSSNSGSIENAFTLYFER